MLSISFLSFAGWETELIYVCKSDTAIGLVALGTEKPFPTQFNEKPTYYIHKLVGSAFEGIVGQAVASFNREEPMINYIAYLNNSLPGWHSYIPAELPKQNIAINQTFLIRTDNFFVFSSGPVRGDVTSRLHESYALFSGYCRKP